MPRVIVTTTPSQLPSEVSVLLDEQVHAVHLSSGHGAAQLVERIAWAITDAEDAEGSHSSAALGDAPAPARSRVTTTRSARSRGQRPPRRSSVTRGAVPAQ
jgi:hypothetical protein